MKNGKNNCSRREESWLDAKIYLIFKVTFPRKLPYGRLGMQFANARAYQTRQASGHRPYRLGMTPVICVAIAVNNAQPFKNTAGMSVPETLSGKCLTGAGFQVPLERRRPLQLLAGVRADEAPTYIFGGVERPARIISGEALFQVGGKTDMVFVRRRNTTEQIDVVNSQSPFAFSFGRHPSRFSLGAFLSQTECRLGGSPPEAQRAKGGAVEKTRTSTGLPHSDLNATRLPFPP